MDWYDVKHPWTWSWRYRHPFQWTEGSAYGRHMRGRKLLWHQRLYEWYTTRRWNKHFYFNQADGHVYWKETGERAG